MYISKHKKNIVKSKYCFGSEVTKLISFNCIKNKNCDAIKSYSSTSKLSIYSQIGNPYHNKCYWLGGEAKLIEYFNGNDWEQTGICEFKDQSFISVFNSL